MYTSIIHAPELVELLDQPGLSIIDCRFVLGDTEAGHNAYTTSHIPNSYYAHLDRDLSGEVIPGETGRHPFPIVENFIKKCSQWGIDKTSQVVVYDHGHGGIAARLWYLLKWLGHENVAVLNGGWNQWVKMGFPESQDLPKFSRITFYPKTQQNWLVLAEEMKTLSSNEKYSVFDSRTSDRFRGENETIDPVAGHIPGAVSAPFVDNLDENGLFLEKKKLVERFDKLLVGKSPADVVFYCGSGVTACHNILAMSYIGKEGAKLYPGSWSEWITDKNRPVAIGG